MLVLEGKVMRTKLLLTATLVGLLCLTACDVMDMGPMERFHRDFHYSYPLQANGRLEVETFNGSVEISGWDQNTVDISGTKFGRTQELADNLRIDIQNTPQDVAIHVPRPSDWHTNQGARFVIKVPRATLLDRITTSNGAIRTMDGSGPAKFRTSNGEIRVLNLHGNLEAQTSNGLVELQDVDGDVTAHSSNGRIHTERLQGTLDASTSNASIQAEIGRTDRPVHAETSNGAVELTLPEGFSRDVRAHTSNSSITLRLPASWNSRVSARTSNSSITSDFEMRMDGEFSKNHVEGNIGNGGGALLDLSTSNGGIRILRR